MSDNVVFFDGVTRWNLPADQVLDQAPRDMDQVVVIGFDAEGELYFSSSVADGGDVLWLLEKAKKELLSIGDDA